jgi:hypothetical protein
MLWVRVRIKSVSECSILRNNYQAEILRSSLQKSDRNNAFIDIFVAEAMLAKLKGRYAFRILGDVNEMTKKASQFVSKTNRYKTSGVGNAF